MNKIIYFISKMLLPVRKQRFEEQRKRVLKFYEKYMLFIGIGGNFLYVLQAYKMIVNRSAQDVSLTGFIISFGALLSWLIYGTLKKDSVLVKVNVFASCVALICIIVIFVLRAT